MPDLLQEKLYLLVNISLKNVSIFWLLPKTWLREGNEHKRPLPSRVQFFFCVSTPTSREIGGGAVGFVIRANIDVICIPQQEFKTFETCTIRLNSNHPVSSVFGYRPPPLQQNDVKMTQFI